MTFKNYPIYTVSQLNQEVSQLLVEGFPSLFWLEGEISNLREPGSGHCYFSLKDSHAQVRCALFRRQTLHLKTQPKDGMHVLVQARVSLYETRGDFQLIVEHLEEVGDGALQRAFEALKKRLSQAGLFDPAHKKILPKLPNCIGIVTSSTGAAVRDILSVLRRRFPAVPVIIYPTTVQGTQAAGQIVQAIEIANLRQECDVLILSRGGGSLEDLWPFNEEKVAYAIYNSEIPIVTGIGHEIDFTIADFVADQRAATPSAAAELVSPDASEWEETIHRIKMRLAQSMQTLLQRLIFSVAHLEKRLPHPKRRLEDQIQRLDELTQRVHLAYRHFLRHKQAELNQAYTRFERFNFLDRLKTLELKCSTSQQRLNTSIRHQLTQQQDKLNYIMQVLDSVSPLNTLQRGYAIITHNEKIVSDAQTVKSGDVLKARLAKGTLVCAVSKETPTLKKGVVRCANRGDLCEGSLPPFL